MVVGFGGAVVDWSDVPRCTVAGGMTGGAGFELAWLPETPFAALWTKATASVTTAKTRIVVTTEYR
jgi:hypothetical protein